MENKFDNSSQVVTSRVDVDELALLDKGAQLSGRNRSDVIRRLIQLIDTPAGRAILGITQIPEGAPVKLTAPADWQAEQ